MFAFRGGKFITVGDRIRLPDDVTMGYIIEHLLKKQLTVVEQFHSHLEPMKFLNKDTFDEQVCFLILFRNYEIIVRFWKARYPPKLWNFIQFHNSKTPTSLQFHAQFLNSFLILRFQQFNDLRFRTFRKHILQKCAIPNFSISVIQFHHADD